MSDTKIAKTQAGILPQIQKRWSPRAFQDKPVDTATLELLFEAASWAASSYNEQPWRFILGSKQDSPAVYDKLFDCLVPGNQGWVPPAPVLGIVVIKETFSQNGNPNKHAPYDAGAAMAQLCLQAVTHDIMVHQMGGFDADKARSSFHIPEGYSAFTAFCLGYQGDATQLPEGGLRDAELAPRTRKALSEIVFSDWEQPAF